MGNKTSTKVEPTNENEEEDEYGSPYKFEPDFTGPVKKRSCTDVLCLALFLLLFVVWGFVAYQGVAKGDINKVRIFLRCYKIVHKIHAVLFTIN